MRTPNWKRQGLSRPLTGVKKNLVATGRQREIMREQKLASLPYAIREQVRKQPQLLDGMI